MTPAASHKVVATSAARGASSVRSVMPLWTMTPANRPAAAGEASRCTPSPPPAERPNTVTRGIATERGDVVLHPLQRGDRVVQTEVGGVTTDRACVEEAQRTQAVVRRHDDDVLLGREPVARVRGL